jgi:DNA-binding phage protein
LSTHLAVNFKTSGAQMLNLDQIRERLAHSNLRAVAQAAGLHYNTVYKLMTTAATPSYATVKALSDYLESWK